jgi:hypothetical protein
VRRKQQGESPIVHQARLTIRHAEEKPQDFVHLGYARLNMKYRQLFIAAFCADTRRKEESISDKERRQIDDQIQRYLATKSRPVAERVVPRAVKDYVLGKIREMDSSSGARTSDDIRYFRPPPCPYRRP